MIGKKSRMHVRPLKTPLVNLNDSLLDLVMGALPPLEEGTVIAITSKIVSLCQGAVLPQSETDFASLVAQEADACLEAPSLYPDIYLTLKDHMLLPNAGIDASNAGAFYILYPRHAQETLVHLWHSLREARGISKLGLIMTDSRTTPLRRGVTGVALGWCGFAPLHSYVGQEDLMGRPLRVTQINLLDALATTAVLVMGEANEQTPIALITGAPFVTFQDHPPTPEDVAATRISLEEDLYAPLFEGARWRTREGSAY
ncbi:MAG: putative folate metabolism gamma-glutamate ligase [Candidatus Puniceispirillum sp.]|nr:putative folate metabolism gamma-glutamate ligase [Candidatus Puniceispirillum sp.]